jgi:hypothetical protein
MRLPLLAALATDGTRPTWSGPLLSLAVAVGEVPFAALLAYTRTGEPEVPADVLAQLPTVTLRAIGAGVESQACEVEAGPPELLGQSIHLWALEATAGLADMREAIEARARFIDARPLADREAVARFYARGNRLRDARLARAVVELDGETGTPLAVLDRLPAELAETMRQELAGHLERIGRLRPQGKAPSGPPPPSPPAPSLLNGNAPSAEPAL